MVKQFILLLFTSLISCNSGNLKIIADLPEILKEASGNEITTISDLIWVINDSGNSPKLYGINEKGLILKELKIKAKNNDWEDITSDKEGNLYIGDFGNNNNKRKNLAVLKVTKNSMNTSDEIDVERISFKYPNQQKFPPKKEGMYFDCEAFFHYRDSLFLFTKSHVKNDFGKTNLYKIPAKQGNYVAEFVSSFNTCFEIDCWITAADISNDGKIIALLTPKSVWVFSNFKDTNFFNGSIIEIPLNHTSQKEGLCFKNNTTLYITDEKAYGSDGFLYEFNLII